MTRNRPCPSYRPKMREVGAWGGPTIPPTMASAVVLARTFALVCTKPADTPVVREGLPGSVPGGGPLPAERIPYADLGGNIAAQRVDRRRRS
jgi:hypothetical protein